MKSIASSRVLIFFSHFVVFLSFRSIFLPSKLLLSTVSMQVWPLLIPLRLAW